MNILLMNLSRQTGRLYTRQSGFGFHGAKFKWFSWWRARSTGLIWRSSQFLISRQIETMIGTSSVFITGSFYTIIVAQGYLQMVGVFLRSPFSHHGQWLNGYDLYYTAGQGSTSANTFPVFQDFEWPMDKSRDIINPGRLLSGGGWAKGALRIMND